MISNRRRVVDVHDEERNRWLSEDEGLDGVARTIGRRRRRQSSGDGAAGGGNGGGGGPGPGSTVSVADRQSTNASGGPGPSTISRIEDKINLAVAPKGRPHTRRARSYDTTRPEPAAASAVRAADVTNQSSGAIGSQPPRIQDIVPGPSSPANVFGLGLPQQPPMLDKSGIQPIDTSAGSVPDFASGRGGDGIGGIGLPVGGVSEDIDDATLRKEQQSKLLDTLRNVLGW